MYFLTSFSEVDIVCPNCDQTFLIQYEASINTWIDPDLIQKVIDDKYFYRNKKTTEK